MVADNPNIKIPIYDPCKKAIADGKDNIKIKFKGIEVSCNSSEALELLRDLEVAVRKFI